MPKCSNCGEKGPNYREGPRGYLQWQNWAKKMSKTHKQEQCPVCGRWTIWKKRGKT